MQCSIEWNILSLPEWETRYGAIRRANLLQSYDYARAACAVNRQKARWGLIKIDGAEAGLVQILEAGLFGNMIHALALDRGPLWFDGYGTTDHINAFFSAFDRAFPRRFGRRRRIIPEATAFSHPAYKKRPGTAYSTIWLDLTRDEETLRAGLDKKWRNALKKGENSDISIIWDEQGASLSTMLTKYQLDRAKKEYDGPSVRLLRAMAKSFTPQGRLLIGHAYKGPKPENTTDREDIAAIMILTHGSGATYQVGWSSDQGRKYAAHNVLLWQALCRLKQKGIRDFDLGGINDDAQGLKKFKEGMAGKGSGKQTGETLTYAGLFV